MIFTLTTPDADDERIAAVMGTYLNLGRPATTADIEDLLARYFSTAIQQTERQMAVSAAIADAEAAVQPISMIRGAAVESVK